MSKRKLRKLVEEGRVSGWDDPRMPTLCGLRRRGYTPQSIRNFCERIGVAKNPSTVEYAFLEHCLREDLNETAQRVMAVLHPVKLVITNYPEGRTELFEVENNPNRPEDGTREVSFSRELWIVGSSVRLITGRSCVQITMGPPLSSDLTDISSDCSVHRCHRNAKSDISIHEGR